LKIDKTSSLEKAKNYAFLLLKFRPRSEKELFFRLKKKKFQDSIIKETITFLKEKKFLDDEIFAASWISARLKKPLGLKRIKEELRQKGINQKIIEQKIQEIKDNYSEEKIVKEIIEKRLPSLKNIASEKIKQRLFAYLVRRGFSLEVVMDVLNQIF